MKPLLLMLLKDSKELRLRKICVQVITGLILRFENSFLGTVPLMSFVVYFPILRFIILILRVI